jgi:hypothetical protein
MIKKSKMLEGLKEKLEDTMDTVSNIVHGKLGSAPKGEKSKGGAKKDTSQK